MRRTITTTLAALAAGSFPAIAQAVASSSNSGGVPLDWGAILEKTGTVSILVWMLIWFQRRLEAREARSEGFADRALTCLGEAAESMKEVASALRDLKTEIHEEHRK